MLQKEIYEVARKCGWYDGKGVTLESLFLRIQLELAEAIDAYNSKKGYCYNDKGKPEGIAVELADIVIPIYHFCEHNNINIEAIIRIKNEYNKTRPYRHGNKLF